MRLKALITAAVLLCTGCESIAYKHTIQQGNVIEPEALESIRVGDSQEKVLAELGAPILRDPFHPNRWDYVYSKQAMHQPAEHQHVVIHFEDQRVESIGTK